MRTDRAASMRLGPAVVQLEWKRARSSRRRPLAVAAAMALLALIVLAAPAGADTSASVTASVSVLIRSVSASPPSIVFDECGYVHNNPSGTYAALPIPNGECGSSTHWVTLAFGTAPSSLAMSATPFVPSDGGTPWALCSSTARADLPGCTGAAAHNFLSPGLDEARLNLSSPIAAQGGDVSTTPDCPWRAAYCQESANGTDKINPFLIGPNATTDPSLTFTTTITFYALPPS